ncbi:MAG TPA: alpha/beta fold hydrolase [Deltaproteobacteria bacterium]|nr:alpha/beta fold hydrolase [Deltaproteobacteria bacterium]HQJ08838.1 alpha/beta fold hydrolase [Deltaproteobacteria bacterium]
MAGFEPVETPSRRVFSRSLVSLKAYGSGQQTGPAVLIVPAPIKRAYIWDLSPQVSVVRHCLSRNMHVYLTEWKAPGPDDDDIGLDDYAEGFILDCLDALQAELGQRQVFLAGHSIGGTFCAIFSSLHSERILGLVLLGTPVRFGPDVGMIDLFAAISPPARSVTSCLGTVPGSFMSFTSSLVLPESFQAERWIDFIMSLPDPEKLKGHARVVRWTLDELPMPRKLFEDIMEKLYRENRFLSGTLKIGGRNALPEHVSAPVLSVADKRSLVAPPRSSLEFHDAVSSHDKQVLWYQGDVGIALQHVGMLAGENAHKHLWPEIIDWMHAHAW